MKAIGILHPSEILPAPDFVQPVLLVASSGQAFDTPAGASYVIFSFNADFYVGYGSTAAVSPAASSTGSSGFEQNPTARRLTTANCTGISLYSDSAAKGSLAWFKV